VGKNAGLFIVNEPLRILRIIFIRCLVGELRHPHHEECGFED